MKYIKQYILLRHIFEKCNELPEITYIPKNSISIIGHAYGSHAMRNPTLDPSVLNFLKHNQENLSRVIFTGDLIRLPSANKWKSLFKLFTPSTIVDIAPGNHDIGIQDDNAYRDIFWREYSFFKDIDSLNYPYYFTHKENIYIIDNSSRVGSILKLVSYMRSNQKLLNNKNIFVLRHHIMSRSMGRFSNTGVHIEKLMSDSQIKSLSLSLKVKSLTLIYGDSGAFNFLPRLACRRSKNILQVANGIGGKDKDMIVIIHNGEPYKYTLN